MKPCTYCGRENEAAATHCGECGTEFAADIAETQPEPLLNPGTLKTILNIVGLMFLGVTIYFLSFGPIFRWTDKTTWLAKATITPPLTTTSTNGITIVHSDKRIAIPGWVGVVYSPSITLMNGRRGTFGDLYNRYIEWWEKPSP